MKRIIYILVFIPFILLSCEDDSKDSVFEETSDERVANLIKEYKEVLEAEENGWKTVYFPNDELYGGFTYVIKFNGETNEVTMYSDIIETGSSTSTYSFKQQQEPSLIFDTYGLLHELSNPVNGIRGEGFQGEFEFYFREIKQDTIFLEGKLHGKPMILTKASATDPETLGDNYKMLTNIVGNPKQSVFRNVEINGSPICSFEYYPSGRSVVVSYEEDDQIKQVQTGVGVSPEGFFFNNPLVIGDVSLTKFLYDEENSLFVDEAVNAKLMYSDVPGAPLTPYYFGEFKDNGRYNYFEPEKSSLAWAEFYDGFIADMTAVGIEIQRIYMRLLMDTENPQIFQVWTNYGTVEYYFTYEIKEDGKVYFTLTGETNAPDFTQFLQPLLDVMLGSEKGYYLRDTGGLLQYSNGTFSLINADNPAIEINYYDF